MALEVDFALVQPDILSAFFEFGFNSADRMYGRVEAITDENAKRSEWFFQRDLSMLRANPELGHLREHLTALAAFRLGAHCSFAALLSAPTNPAAHPPATDALLRQFAANDFRGDMPE
jgi:hypothetical protein